GITVPAMSAMPSDSDALSRCPSRDTCANRIDDAGDFVTEHARVLNAGKDPVLRIRVTVADAAGLNLDSDRSGARLRDITFDELKGALRARDLHATHLRHRSLHIRSCSWRGED